MNIGSSLLLVIQMVSALAMVGLVLVQHGKGADMGASFGSGASGSLFGATGSANFLSRSTAVCATVFFLATLGLAMVSGQGSTATVDTGSVLDRAAPPALATSAALPAQPQIPAALPTANGSSSSPAQASSGVKP